MQKKRMNQAAALLIAFIMAISQSLPAFALQNESSASVSVSSNVPLSENESLSAAVSNPKQEEPEPDPSKDLQSSPGIEPSASPDTAITSDLEASIPPTDNPVINSKPQETYGFEPFDNTLDFETQFFPNQLRARLAATTQTAYLVVDDVQFLEQWYSDGYHIDRWYPKRVQQTGQVAYCVEHGVSIPNVYQGGYTPKELAREEYQRISLADYYGRTTRGGNALQNEFMVQLYIWELLSGAKPTALYYDGHPEWAPWVSLDDYATFKREIQPKVDAFFSKPTFDKTDIKLKPGQTVILTDTSGSLSMYEETPIMNTTNLDIRRQGNSLIITANSNSKNGSFAFRYNLPDGFGRGVPLYYENPNSQDLAVFGRGDPTGFQINIDVIKNGYARIVKTSEDGVVAGIPFDITGNGKTYRGTTGANGDLQLELPGVNDSGQIITYTATEASVPGRYTPPSSQTFTIEPNQTTTINFSNNLKKGTLRLIKKAEDGIVSGIKLELSGGGQTYNRTTGDGGIVDITGLRVCDSNNNKIQYTAREVGTPGRYTVPASQTFTLTENATTTITFQNNLKKGTLRLIKKAEDGIVSGIKLELTGGGQTYNRTTGDGGIVDITGLRVCDSNNNKIQYTAREIDTPLRYVQPVSQTFTLTENQTTTITFVNNLKKGNTKLVKASEDDDIAGKDFRLTGAGQTYERKTGNGGIIDVTGMRVYDSNNVKITYTAQEINVPEKYVIPPAQTFTLEYGQTTTLYFSNVLKKWQLTVNKKDNEQNSAQGDATLAGAKYGIYKGDMLLDTYITDSSHSFTTRLYVCGGDYTLREITPSTGYLLDDTIYPVGVTPGQTNIEINVRAANVKESVIKGIIGIIKHTDNGETQIETPEVGAEFDVYLKSAGSYADAKESERDHLICDEDGYDQTKRLPYGVYVVKQTKSWDGRDLLPAFEVYIAKDSKIYRYIINNSFFEGYLKISKKDAETGNVIPYAGAGFQILDPAGDLVKMRVTYPKHMEIDTFYTADDGTLITPQKLPYGLDYKLIEVQAPFGYILDSTPVEFDITQDLANEENGIKLVKVEKSNKPQMGRVTLTKTGAALTTVNDTDGSWQPVYEERALSDAVYEIVAKEDIVTPDGTVRALAGHVVDELHTGYVGKDISQALYLGKYQAIETKAPEGYVLNDTPIDFELTYAGQEVAISKTEIAAVDERQKVKISLAKIMEQDEHFGAGTNGEIIDVQFGLFAAEKITARDGTIIPADGLIETIVMKADGTQTFKTDLPFGKYYLQEIATNAQYILSDTKYPVEFAYQGQDIALVEIAANDGKPIENTLKRGSVTLTKTDKELPDERLSGAEFEVYQDVDGSGDFNSDTDLLIGSMKETEQGIYTLDKLTYGSYLVYEKTAPEGLLPNTSYYPFKIMEDGKIVEVETTKGKGFENSPLKGTVRTTKVNADDPTDKLPGGVFDVYKDMDGNGKYSEDIDVLAGTLSEIEFGVYELAGIRYGQYLFNERTAPEGFIRDENYYAFSITEDGQLVQFDSIPGKDFPNHPKKGTIRTTKVNAEDPTDKLPGGIFDIYKDVDKDGKFTQGVDTLHGTLTEFKPGEYELTDIPAGKYLFNERTAPEGFIRDTNYYPFEIVDDGQLVEFNSIPGKDFPNHPKKGTIQTTKVNADDPTDKLPGGVFDVFKDVDKDGKFTQGVDTLHGTLTEFKPGEYELTDIPGGHYLFNERTAPKGFVRDANYYPFEIAEDGQVIKFESIPGKDFPNHPAPPIPQTGDNKNILPWLLLSGGSAAIIVFSLTIKRKRGNKSKS